MKPVAWTDDLWNIFLNDEYCMLDDGMKKDMIPLYTAPRELSGSEINNLWSKYGWGSVDIEELHTFVQEILKKASEK